MSELKEHLFCECDECIREYRGPLSNEMRPYYLKSEADKVITKLKEKLVEQATLRAWAELQLRHNKYKRCLAMAKYCQESAMWLEEYGITKSATFMLWWEKRWLELADKFKEAK